MATNTDKTSAEKNARLSGEEFLLQAVDDDVLKFLRRLPIVGGGKNERVTMADLTYEMQLWPYVKEAWAQVDGSPGIPNRLAQIIKIYAKAESALEADFGKVRRHPRKIDLEAFLDGYTTVGLP